MKPQELRIGNEVEWDDDSREQVKVLSISYIMEDDGEITNYFINGGLIDDFLPIPITPEWLDGRGLRYLQNACWELGSYRIYNVSGDRPRFRITIAGHEIVVVSYVHQLQNLYFDLTGKEL